MDAFPVTSKVAVCSWQLYEISSARIYWTRQVRERYGGTEGTAVFCKLDVLRCSTSSAERTCIQPCSCLPGCCGRHWQWVVDTGRTAQTKSWEPARKGFRGSGTKSACNAYRDYGRRVGSSVTSVSASACIAGGLVGWCRMQMPLFMPHDMCDAYDAWPMPSPQVATQCTVARGLDHGPTNALARCVGTANLRAAREVT